MASSSTARRFVLSSSRGSLLIRPTIAAPLLRPISASYHSTRVVAAGRKAESAAAFRNRNNSSSAVTKKKPSKESASAAAKSAQQQETASTPENMTRSVDPHALASEFIQKSEGRMQGTEALASLTTEQKMRNYATALALLGFVGGVFWYSVQAVGRSEGGIEELRAEADEARRAAEGKKSLSEEEAEKLVGLEMTMANLDETEDGDEIGDDVIVAVAAPDAIAREEEEQNLAARDRKKGSRPLWKKVVFFWQRE